jgi:hypothetical protein
MVGSVPGRRGRPVRRAISAALGPWVHKGAGWEGRAKGSMAVRPGRCKVGRGHRSRARNSLASPPALVTLVPFAYHRPPTGFTLGVCPCHAPVATWP